MNLLEKIEASLPKPEHPAFGIGDIVKIHVRISEGGKDRIQVFQGTVIGRKRASNRSMFTVRKISHGVAVERVFPLYSPAVAKIEILTRNRMKRAKLYYLREREGKAARIRDKARIVETTAEATE